MANALFDSYRKSLVGDGSTAAADWNGDTIKAALIDAGTTDPAVDTHDFWNDLSSAAVGTPVALTCSYPSAGKVDASDFTFTSVSGNSAEEMVVFKDTGTASTSPLLVLYDTFSSGMPVTPNGGDIAITVNAYVDLCEGVGRRRRIVGLRLVHERPRRRRRCVRRRHGHRRPVLRPRRAPDARVMRPLYHRYLNSLGGA